MLKTEILPAVEINPALTPAKASVIWLHGLGADGHDFESIVPELRLPKELAVRFVFPHAPMRPVTINNGMRMRAWFDISALERGATIDEAGVLQASQAVAALIAQEIEHGVPSQKIVLAGFSQGGAIALQCGLSYPQPLAGILGLSTFLPFTPALTRHFSSANKNIPIMLAHGTSDPMVPVQLGELCREQLTQLGHKPVWHIYPMQHQVCGEEIHDIARWLEQVLSD